MGVTRWGAWQGWVDVKVGLGEWGLGGALQLGVVVVAWWSLAWLRVVVVAWVVQPCGWVVVVAWGCQWLEGVAQGEWCSLA